MDTKKKQRSLISDGPLKLEDIPMMNFGHFMLDHMRNFGSQPALINGSSKQTYTYYDVILRSERLAAGLQTYGVKPGDIVCIFAPNHIDYLVTFYAVTLINATLQAVNPLFTTEYLHQVFRDCDTKLVITVPELVSKVTDASTELGLVSLKVLVMGERKGYTSLDSILAPIGSPYSTPETDWKATTAVLLYSSGTTGFPKAVKNTHYSLIANHVQTMHADTFETGESLVNFLPFFHMYGLLFIGSMPHCRGCREVFMPRFEFEKYLKLIEIYKPNVLHVVPPTMVLFAKHPKVSEYDLSSVERLMCAAAPLSAEIEEAVKNKLKLKNIQQGYGMTEVGATHLKRRDELRKKTVGKCLELVELKIVDVETGRTLGSNQEGEVWIRGPQVTTGYLNLPTQTREVFLEDGWVRTGDIGKQDEDGFLYIVERLKEIIKYKGFQVAPALLEDAILRNDAVADVGVIGVPDEEAGELPRAFVVKKPRKNVTEKDIMEYVASLVPPYMKLRGGVEFIDEIPRNQSGKILRRILREKAKTTKSKL